MYRKLIGVIVLTGITLSQAASVNDSSLTQTDFRGKYARNAIVLQNSFLKGQQFVVNGKSYPVGFFNSRLKKIMSPVPEATKLLDAGNTNLKYGVLTTVLGFSFTVSTLFRDVVYPEDMGKNVPDALLVLAAGSLVADYFYLKATNLFHKAVWVYNRESVFLPVRTTADELKETIYKPGYNTTFVRSDLYVLGYHGNLYSLRLGKWDRPWLESGIEASFARLSDYKKSANLWRLYYYYGFYLRQLGVFYPYLVVSGGFQGEPQHSAEREDEGVAAGTSVKSSSAVKVGVAVEAGAFRLSMETGGGSMGTGHVEPTTIALSYALRPLPEAELYKDYNVTAGIQSFVATTGKYRGESGGFDFNLQRKVDGKMKNYNVGIFMTDYMMSTGVFHGGIEWNINKGNPLSRYVDIMPGYQILLWAEPEPDFILPAASLSIRAKLPIWKVVFFARLRAIATISPKAGVVTGILLSNGFGFAN